VCLPPAQIEFVYNNGGYIAQTQGEQYFNIWSDTEPNDTLQTFQKTPGEFSTSIHRRDAASSADCSQVTAVPAMHMQPHAGTLEGSSDACSSAWLKGHLMPSAGTGVSMMPANPDTSWWNATLWKSDPLYNEIAFGASGMQFFLGHHTFTHENMNNVTYNDAYQQIRLNQVRIQFGTSKTPLSAAPPPLLLRRSGWFTVVLYSFLQ
jgi:hypothetical protein